MPYYMIKKDKMSTPNLLYTSITRLDNNDFDFFIFAASFCISFQSPLCSQSSLSPPFDTPPLQIVLGGCPCAPCPPVSHTLARPPRSLAHQSLWLAVAVRTLGRSALGRILAPLTMCTCWDGGPYRAGIPLPRPGETE